MAGKEIINQAEGNAADPKSLRNSRSGIGETRNIGKVIKVEIIKA